MDRCSGNKAVWCCKVKSDNRRVCTVTRCRRNCDRRATINVALFDQRGVGKQALSVRHTNDAACKVCKRSRGRNGVNDVSTVGSTESCDTRVQARQVDYLTGSNTMYRTCSDGDQTVGRTRDVKVSGDRRNGKVDTWKFVC